jgi:hypothetical protein
MMASPLSARAGPRSRIAPVGIIPGAGEAGLIQVKQVRECEAEDWFADPNCAIEDDGNSR